METDTPVHAEQCNHEFLRSISEWPSADDVQPSHYVDIQLGVVLLHIDSEGIMHWFYSNQWHKCAMDFICTTPLSCTREMWQSAHAVG